MLRLLRDNSRSLIVWVLLGIIMAFFIISFGPQANENQFRCSGTTDQIASVGGQPIPERSWRMGMVLRGFSSGGANLRAQKAREQVMDLLLAREMLAQAAEAAGLGIPDDYLDSRIADGHVLALGRLLVPIELYLDEDGVFQFDRFELWVQRIGLRSPNEFREEERRELLANTYISVLAQGVRVSEEEVRSQFLHDNTTVTADTVRFNPDEYAKHMLLSDADIEQYLRDHESEIQNTYAGLERTYKGVSAQVRARHMFFARKNPIPAAPEPPAGEEAPAPPTPDTPPAPTTPSQEDPGHVRASNARARVAAGASFAEVAREMSESELTQRKGGDLGWVAVANLGLGAEVSEAAQKLEVNQLSDIIETADGFHLLIVEGKREGDLSFDDVKLELAADAALKAYAREAARRDAEAALAEVLAAASEDGKHLAARFERREQAPPPSPFQMPAPPSQPDLDADPAEDSEQEPGKKTGAVLREGPAIPASFASTASTWQTEPAAEPAAPTDAAKPAGAPSGGKSPTSAFPADAQIPKPDGLEPPKVVSSGPIRREGEGNLEGDFDRIGKSVELQRALFDEMDKGQVGKQIYEVDDGFVLVELVDRDDPDLTLYDNQKDGLFQRQIERKSQRLVQRWLDQRCEELKSEIEFLPSVVTYSDPESGENFPVTYQPCTTRAFRAYCEPTGGAAICYRGSFQF